MKGWDRCFSPFLGSEGGVLSNLNECFIPFPQKYLPFTLLLRQKIARFNNKD